MASWNPAPEPLKGWKQSCDFKLVQVARRPSLPPPPNSGVTWTEYQSSVPGKPLTLGRKVVAKASSKQFKATVAMSEDFPMKVDMLLAVLEVIAPQFKHFNKLRDFVKLKLPPGKKKVELKCLNSAQDSRSKSTFLYSLPCQPRCADSFNPCST